MKIIEENLNYYIRYIQNNNSNNGRFNNITVCDGYCSGDCDGLGCGDNGCYDSCGGDWDY